MSIAALSAVSFFDLTDFAHPALFQNCVYVWEALTHLSAYLQKQKLGHIAVDIPSGAFLLHPGSISIGEGSVVEPGAYIEGPCIIGEGCTIRHGAYIRGNVVVGDGCVIGHATEVKHSIFLDGAHAPHFNYVGDSILGKGVNLGAGAICANLKFDRKGVNVHFEKKKIATGLTKLGAILGDGAQVGCHCVLNPGTLMGKNSFCYPSLNVGGYIAESQVYKGK